MEILRVLGTYGIYACTVLALTFCVLYLWWGRPMKTEYGRLILFSNAVLGFLCLFISLRNLFGDNQVLAFLRLVLFLMIPAYLAWQIWLLYRTQRRGHVNRSGNKE